ncbi:hypothetical protein E3U43_010679 [Larimichthys crocea]|uniref:Uncharacterized protein n=1 Tax=Larimichthys crocea TaxID=215358 RepID=A0ACD3RIA7_LARCR|nr:hypothetical protein E3U43_010679 [Larimichthys crocea]
MHLQSPKGVERGRQPPARSILHSAWIRFYPLLTPPSFLPPHVFVLNIHLLAHLWQRQLAAQVFSVFIRTPTRNLSMYKGTKHTSSLYIRGEKKKQKQKNKNKHAAFATKITRSSLYIQHTALTPWLHLQWHLDSCKRSSLNSF